MTPTERAWETVAALSNRVEYIPSDFIDLAHEIVSDALRAALDEARTMVMNEIANCQIKYTGDPGPSKPLVVRVHEGFKALRDGAA